MRRRQAFRPFATRGRRTIAGILATFALFSTLTVTVSIWATSGSQHRASVLEVAARQRTLAERYVKEILLARAGAQADPAHTGRLLARSADALLDGGVAPAVNGDDDETPLPRASGATVRAQLAQERRLVRDLTATGAAVLSRRPVTAVKLTADERLSISDPVERLRVLSALTSNVSLNAARTIGAEDDRSIARLIVIEVVLGAVGLLTSLLLAFGLIAATRRQTAHFRSLVTSSTDLVLVFGDGGCRYASESVANMLGHPEDDLLGEGFARFVHEDDRAALCAAYAHGEPHEIVFRVANEFREWRHLEAHVTDLRADRQIRGIVLNARDITERLRLEEELTRQAFHDGLTGLPNRALFRDRLDQSLARSERSQEGLAVLLLDLDGFKQVNDSLGHDAGDQLLEEVAGRFGEVTRPADTLARFGGDEFALLLDGANEAQAVAAADRLVRNLSEPIRIAGHELALGASVGIAMHTGGAGESEELVRQADLAMYAAKEAGRGRHEVFRYDMARELGELLGLEHELRLGLQRGEFSLHYQPEIALDTAAIVGVEALLRWQSPTRGAVPPAEFIPIAEATGLIVPLGEFVLHEACAQTARWRRDAALPDGFVTWTNLSGKQLSAGGVGALVREALEAAALPPGFLGLEVTETALVQEGHAGERARAELQELHELGVRIAVDDFGTGFSSLGQLRSFPVDMIKVDRSFVQGIESDGQLTSLRELGCDLAQGFLFARPAPPDQIDRLLAERPTKVSGRREAAA